MFLTMLPLSILLAASLLEIQNDIKNGSKRSKRKHRIKNWLAKKIGRKRKK